MALNDKRQMHQALERHSVTARDKHEERFLLFHGHFIDHPPEHDDGGMGVAVPFVVGSRDFKLVEIDHRAAADQKLQLVGAEQGQHLTSTDLT